MASTPQSQDGASLFTPIHPFDMEAPKTWGGSIGMMHWDNDKIVFSKRSLLEFLKSCNVTVNQNFTEINKLPKYASFGKLSEAATDAAVKDMIEAEIADPHPSAPPALDRNSSSEFRPTRKVREAPGGKQTLNIFGGDDDQDRYEHQDALSLAPSKTGDGVDVELTHEERMRIHLEGEEERKKHGTVEEIEDDMANKGHISNPPANFRPTRKVREGPGGKSTLGDTLFGPPETEEEIQARLNTSSRR